MFLVKSLALDWIILLKYTPPTRCEKKNYLVCLLLTVTFAQAQPKSKLKVCKKKHIVHCQQTFDMCVTECVLIIFPI